MGGWRAKINSASEQLHSSGLASQKSITKTAFIFSPLHLTLKYIKKTARERVHETFSTPISRGF